jgi:hypothetical protein
MVRGGREVGLPAVSLSSIGLPDREVIALNFDHCLAVPNKSRRDDDTAWKPRFSFASAWIAAALASNPATALAANPAACVTAGTVGFAVGFVMFVPCIFVTILVYSSHYIGVDMKSE